MSSAPRPVDSGGNTPAVPSSARSPSASQERLERVTRGATLHRCTCSSLRHRPLTLDCGQRWARHGRSRSDRSLWDPRRPMRREAQWQPALRSPIRPRVDDAYEALFQPVYWSLLWALSVVYSLSIGGHSLQAPAPACNSPPKSSRVRRVEGAVVESAKANPGFPRYPGLPEGRHGLGHPLLKALRDGPRDRAYLVIQQVATPSA